MSYAKRLPCDATLVDVFKAYPATARPLLEFHQMLLRGPSPLTVEVREMIAAFVSGLNACGYCFGVHEATARRFGLRTGLIAQLLDDLEGAPVDPKLRPILAYVRKLTLTPSKLTQADADAVYAAGWSDAALHDAVCVCALFNFMNRLVEGLGIEAGPDYFDLASGRLHDAGYAALLKLLD